MSNKKMDELLSGNYDGIQEYDNNLPRWWSQLFILTVIYAVIYVVYAHLIGTPTDHQMLAEELRRLEGQRLALEAERNDSADTSDSLLAIASNVELVGKGREVFSQKCAACHGPSGQGLVGPNLTDEFWLHGGQIDQINRTIYDGVPEKGMLAWKSLLSREELQGVLAYVWSIRNTNVPGKAAEGSKS